MSLFDISPPLSESIAVWPGDTPFMRRLNFSISEGATVNVSSMTLSTHTGSHVDAPSHFDDAAQPIDRLPLEPFIGPAVLIHAIGVASIEPSHLERLGSDPPERLLIRTRERSEPDRFDRSFAALAPAAAERLVEMGVRLFGTDAASVDPFASKTLDAHRILAAGGVMILEGLDLDRPPPGRYELIALPLRIDGADASPVRAVLRAVAAGRPTP